jgi:hypothetical protein
MTVRLDGTDPLVTSGTTSDVVSVSLEGASALLAMEGRPVVGLDSILAGTRVHVRGVPTITGDAFASAGPGAGGGPGGGLGYVPGEPTPPGPAGGAGAGLGFGDDTSFGPVGGSGVPGGGGFEESDLPFAPPSSGGSNPAFATYDAIEVDVEPGVLRAEVLLALSDGSVVLGSIQEATSFGIPLEDGTTGVLASTCEIEDAAGLAELEDLLDAQANLVLGQKLWAVVRGHGLASGSVVVFDFEFEATSAGGSGWIADFGGAQGGGDGGPLVPPSGGPGKTGPDELPLPPPGTTAVDTPTKPDPEGPKVPKHPNGWGGELDIEPSIPAVPGGSGIGGNGPSFG